MFCVADSPRGLRMDFSSSSRLQSLLTGGCDDGPCTSLSPRPTRARRAGTSPGRGDRAAQPELGGQDRPPHPGAELRGVREELKGLRGGAEVTIGQRVAPPLARCTPASPSGWRRRRRHPSASSSVLSSRACRLREDEVTLAGEQFAKPRTNPPEPRRRRARHPPRKVQRTFVIPTRVVAGLSPTIATRSDMS